MSDEPRGEGPEPPPADPGIDAYLRANVGTYTRAVLDERLRAAGHSEPQIAAAWARLATRSPGTDRPSGGATVVAVLAVLAVLLVYGGSALLFGLGLALTPGGGSVFNLTAAQRVVLVAYAIVTVAGGLLLVREVLRAERRGAVLRVLGLVALAGVVYAGLSGACIGGLTMVQRMG